MARARITITWVVVLAFVACGDSGTDPDPNAPTGTVDAAGGAVATDDGAVTLAFPPGAVTSSTAITVRPAAAPPASNLLLPGTSHDFEPSGIAFSAPVALTMAYDPATLPAGTTAEALVIQKVIGGVWTPVSGSVVNSQTRTVSAPINGFSTFGVGSLGPATGLEVHAGDQQEGTVGTATAVAPAVLVRSASNQPLPGATVTFAATAGNGTVTGGTVTTNTAGIATVGGWTLGTTTGEHQLTAAVGTLTVTFTATAAAGGAATITKASGDEQVMAEGHDVPDALSVTILDAHGNPVANAPVTFAVTAGGGAITDGTPITDADGRATAGTWTLGTAGENTVTASVEGATPAVFTATAIAACSFTRPIAIGETAASVISGADCEDANGRWVETWTLTSDEQISATLAITADGYDPIIGVWTADGSMQIAQQFVSHRGFARVILAAGTYRITMRNLTVGAAGDYTLSVTADAHTVNECGNQAVVWVTPGVAINGDLTPGDCPDHLGNPEDRWDRYIMFMESGKTYTTTVTGDQAARLAIWRGADQVDLESLFAAGTVEIVYPATVAAFYSLYPIGAQGTDYTLTTAVASIAPDPCDEVVAYTVGHRRNGRLTSHDCSDASDRWTDAFSFTATTQLSARFSFTSQDFPPGIGIWTADGSQQLVPQFPSVPGIVRTIMAPGTYRLVGRSNVVGEGGFYELLSTTGSQDVDECGLQAVIFLTPNVTASGTLTANNCPDVLGDPEERWDRYVLRVVAGQSYTITVALSGEGGLSIWSPSGVNIDFDRRETPGTVILSFTATETGFHSLYPIGGVGTTYTLTVPNPG